jgi:hypothetical protein
LVSRDEPACEMFIDDHPGECRGARGRSNPIAGFRTARLHGENRNAMLARPFGKRVRRSRCDEDRICLRAEG